MLLLLLDEEEIQEVTVSRAAAAAAAAKEISGSLIKIAWHFHIKGEMKNICLVEKDVVTSFTPWFPSPPCPHPSPSSATGQWLTLLLAPAGSLELQRLD